MKFKKIFSAVTIAALSLTVFSGCKGSLIKDTSNLLEEKEDTGVSSVKWLPDVDIHNFIMPEQGEKIAVINVKDYGTIKIKLFPEDAEKGVENFIGLAEMGYYDELIFHRVIKDFMNQGGDPRGDGFGGKSLWGDKFEGGTSEHLYHFAGAVAYANSGATSTNGSQFYIVNSPSDVLFGGTCEELYDYDPDRFNWPANVVEKYKEAGGTPMLDGGYTVFGQVFEGMDVVRAIAQVETDPDSDKPLTQVKMESVRIEEYQG